MANEYPFVKRCSKHVNDHEYKFHSSICYINLSCAHREIKDVRDNVGRDKHKAAKKNQDSKFKHSYFNLMILPICYYYSFLGLLYFYRKKCSACFMYSVCSIHS